MGFFLCWKRYADLTLLRLAVLFCLPAKNNQLSGYYDPNSVISEDLTSSIPDEINTVFWEWVLSHSSVLRGDRI